LAEIRLLRLTRVEEIGWVNLLSFFTLFSLVTALTYPIYSGLSFPGRFEGVGFYMQPYFHFTILQSLAAASLPLAIRVRQIQREVSRLNESVLIMYDSLSSLLRTGMPLMEALDRVADRVTSRILRHRLKIATSLALQGADLDETLSKIVHGLPLRIKNALVGLRAIAEAGGRAPEVAIFMRDFYDKLIAFDRLKKSSLNIYFYILLMSVLVYDIAAIFMIYVYKQVLASPTTFIRPLLTIPQLLAFANLFMLVLILFTSLLVGKMTRGSIKYSFDYFLLFLVLHSALYAVLAIRYA